MMPPRKANSRAEFRQKQRERIEGSPLMVKKYPRLKALKVTLAYYDAEGTTKNGEMKCTLNVEHARSVLCFACPGGNCSGGDFDLSEALAKSVVKHRTRTTGEIQCEGTRKRADGVRLPCETLLRYTLDLAYD